MSKQMIGKVVSAKMQKTLVVEVISSKQHPVYKKIVRKSKRFKVHNEDSQIKVGQVVKIVETRPISKDKRFKVLEKVL